MPVRRAAPLLEAARGAPWPEAARGAPSRAAVQDEPWRAEVPRVAPRPQAVRAFCAPGQMSPRSPRPSNRREEAL
jgi:hypothetical protein